MLRKIAGQWHNWRRFGSRRQTRSVSLHAGDDGIFDDLGLARVAGELAAWRAASRADESSRSNRQPQA
jgi:hypothetical protein